MFVTVAMTGLDQDMMQKNLACRSLGDAQKNMGAFTVILVAANLLFLSMGALLWMHAGRIDMALPEATDKLYPLVALGGSLGPALGVAFLVGLLASAFSSADSALTALTTSTCIDLIDTPSKTSEEASRIRKRVHLGLAVLLWLVIVAFNAVNDTSVVAALFTVANYTYGPLLGTLRGGHVHRAPPRALDSLGLCARTRRRVWPGASADRVGGLQLWVCVAACERVVDSLRPLVHI